MKRINRITIFVLISIIILSSISYGDNAVMHTDKAEALNSLDLFKGTDKGFELAKVSTRAESAAMIVRLLGAEEEAFKVEHSHPFNDVPKWADPYVGYMYKNGLTTGTSKDTYGSNEMLDGKSYMTFILRILGYDDSRGDFHWKEALEFSNEIGILTDNELSSIQSRDFNRDGMVLVTYNALEIKFKDNDNTILSRLNKNLKDSVDTEESDLSEESFEVSVIASVREKNGHLTRDYIFRSSDNSDIDKVYYTEVISSGAHTPTMEELFRRMIIHDLEKDRRRERYESQLDINNRRAYEENYEVREGDIILHYRYNNKFSNPTQSIFVMYDDDLFPAYYVLPPKYLELGEHKIPLIKMDNKLLESLKIGEKQMENFVEKYMKNIGIVPEEAISFVEGEKGIYVKFDRNLLPENMKNFKHVSTTGISLDYELDVDSNEGVRTQLMGIIKHFYDFKDGMFVIYEKDIEDSMVYLKYNQYNRILLFSEDGEPVGFVVVRRP